jgi:hypothetical protein
MIVSVYAVGKTGCLLLWVSADPKCQLYSYDSFDQVEVCLSVCSAGLLDSRQRERAQQLE